MDKLCADVAAIYSKEADHKVQTEKLRKLLENVFSTYPQSQDATKLVETIRHLVETVVNNESTSMVVSRQFLMDVAERISKDFPANLVITIGEVILNLLQARAIAYEEQITQIRTILADAFERSGQLAQAARTLMGIPLETGQRTYRADFKMNLYLRITELFLDADNIVEADRHVKRASLLQQDVKDDLGILLKYKFLYARVLDRQGAFIEAAQRYNELSIKQGLPQSERMHALQNALTCTLLAPPGLHRNRLLNTLFKDERCQQLVGYLLLKNMYLERLIQGSELIEFEASLSPHQKLLDTEGSSILQRSILEHNILAASRLFSNISFARLGQLIGVPTNKAEKIASQMISEDKVGAHINQMDETIYFDVPDSQNRTEAEIASICELTNSINERLAARFPEWHAQRVREYSTNKALNAAVMDK